MTNVSRVIICALLYNTAVIISIYTTPCTDAFSFHHQPKTHARSHHPSTKLYITSNTDSDNSSALGIPNVPPSVVSSAFDALGEKDQYDAVLTGLCAKILDGNYDPNPPRSVNTNTNTGEDAEEDGGEAVVETPVMSAAERAFDALKDPIRLMKEMNSRKIKASERSLMALIDASALTQEPRVMSSILSLSLRNGSLQTYGSLQRSVLPFPPSPSSPVSNRSSKRTTRSKRLQTLPDIPSDDRDIESLAALSALATIGVCAILQTGFGEMIVGWQTYDWAHPVASFTLTSLIVVGVVDNFFDVLSATGSLTFKANRDNLPTKIQESMESVGEKIETSNLPFELGSGKLTGTVVRGLTRLLQVDTERECRCEAASFFVAYSIGLPCFALRPNALEAAVLVFESNRAGGEEEGAIDTLLSDAGMMKLLVWLLAPVAMESSLHPQLIVSEPREAGGVLKRLEEKAKLFGVEEEVSEVLRLGDEGEEGAFRDDLLKWAYAEADLLLRQNKETVTELTERLIGGASTIGDCVAVIEGW